MAEFLYRLGKLQFSFIRIGLGLVLVARILVYDLRTLTNPLVRAKKTLGGPFLCNGKLKKVGTKDKERDKLIICSGRRARLGSPAGLPVTTALHTGKAPNTM